MFFLVCFGGRFLDSSVTATVKQFSCSSLSLSGFFRIDVSEGLLGSTIYAQVDFGNGFLMVEALDMLPSITLLAEDSVTIIVIISTDAFYRVFFFGDIGRRGFRKGMAIGKRRDCRR